MNFIGKYVNGDYTVTIYDDGTKVRAWSDAIADPQTAYPESLDLKIDNRCDVGCAMCHEQSTPTGVLGDLHNPILDTLHPYTELAIGGGNPLEHPDLVEFLQRMKDKKVICNLTVNLDHFLKDREVLRSWSDRGLIHGLGISVGRKVTEYEKMHIVNFPNAVVHVIAGLVSEKIVNSFVDPTTKLLILGYKKVGRGVDFFDRFAPVIKEQIDWLKSDLPRLRSTCRLIAFDNLALQQLNVRSLVSNAAWQTAYMGEDGSHTMYLDLCEKTYAIASTMERHPIPDDVTSIDQLFSLVKAEAAQMHEE